MQKSEKTAEPSMEEILASIRKIIAEEPSQAPQQAPAVPVQQAAEIENPAPEAAVPPGGDLSDILDEPAPPAALVGASTTSEADSQPEQSGGQQLQSPFPQVESEHETPLMARLRGLAGAPSPVSEPNGSSPEDGPISEGAGLAEQAPGNSEHETEAITATPEAPLPSLEIEPEPKPELAAEPVVDAAETVFGKSAAAGIEPVAISIAEEASVEPDLGSVEPVEVSPAVSTDMEEPTVPESPPAEEFSHDAVDSPAQAQIDEVFASLTNEVPPEEGAQVEDLPTLPHQEVVDSQPEDIAPLAVAAVAEPAPPPAAAPIQDEDATPVDQNAAAGTDLETALAALVEPIVHRWLAENVPALVEQVLAEQAKSK